MILKSICFVQAILLTASVVHNMHLEGLLQDKHPAAFYQEKEQQPIVTQQVINEQPANSVDVQLLPPIEQEQDDTVQDLNDVLASNNNPPNHSDALFGGMKEKKKKK